MAWEYSLATHVWIFSVGRGNAAFIRTGLNQGFILDMGRQGDSDFNPAEFVKDNFASKLDKFYGHAIAQAVLSHPHKDHISQCAELKDGMPLAPKMLTCPHDKSAEEMVNWRRIKNPEGSDDLVRTYKSLYTSRNLPLQTIKYESKRSVPNLEYGIYYVRPPFAEKLHTDDNDYGNACSMVFYFRHGGHSILFPGDITPQAMCSMLNEGPGVEKRYTVFDRQGAWKNQSWHEKTSDQPSLRWLLSTRGLTALVAPHHGLESCFCPDFYKAIRGGKPQITIISERRHVNENDGKLHKVYQGAEGSAGLTAEVDGRLESGRRSISTVDGRHILLIFEGTGAPKIYANKNPKYLLRQIGALSKGAVA
jgi:hypothetical protein